MISSYNADCHEGWVAKLSNVPHNSFVESDSNIRYFENYSSPNARIFGLCVLDELDKMGYIS